MKHDRRALLALQLILGETVARCDEFAGAIRAHQQRRQVATGGLPGVPRRLEVLTSGGEVALTLADRVDVQAVEAGRQDACF